MDLLKQIDERIRHVKLQKEYTEHALGLLSKILNYNIDGIDVYDVTIRLNSCKRKIDELNSSISSLESERNSISFNIY